MSVDEVRKGRFRLRIEVLGSLRVAGDGVEGLSRASHQRLLAVFVLEAGRRIGTDRLIDMFWAGSPPSRGKAAIQTHVSALRRLLGSDSIRTEGYGYRLDLEEVGLDVVEFDDAVAVVRRAMADQDWEFAVEASSGGLALWRGSPFPELADDVFARAEIVRLQESYLELWEMWAEALIKLGRPGEALPDLERLVVEHPYRERLWKQLMSARYRLGRHAEALRAYRELSEHLAEIGLEPGPSVGRLEEKILLHQEELNAPPNNLPADLTSFVGRKEELRDVAKLLGDHRLVTLTGVGGSGKTRLGVRAAGDNLDSYPEGCWFVSLADLDDPAQVSSRVCDTLGLQPHGEDPLDFLAMSIRHDEMLLVVDNCEHVRVGVAETAERLLGATKQVKMIATSREPLHVPGEVVYEVPPLASPDADMTADEVSGYDAVRLFVERALLVDLKFKPDTSYPQLGDLCRRLDGIPLAVELAAARIRSFNIEQMISHLDKRFRLLASGAQTTIPRHETLDAAIDWSYQLLDETEQSVFRRLFVFTGGFTYEAAEAVCTDEEAQIDMLQVLPALVDKSLVLAQQTNGDVRYRLLETVRQFARNRSDDEGDTDQWRRRHAEYYARLFDRDQRRAFLGRDGMEVKDRLLAEEANLRQTLAWAMNAGDTDMAAVLPWWLTSVHPMVSTRSSDMIPWFETLEHVLEKQGPPERLAEVLLSHGDLAWVRGDRDQAIELEERAVTIFRDLDAQEVDHDRLLAFPEALSTWALYLLLSRRVGPNNEIYTELQHELLELTRRLDNQDELAKALTNMAHHSDPGGDPAKARRLFEKAEVASQHVSPVRAQNLAHQWAGFEFNQGEFEDAARLWDRGAILSEQVRNPWQAILARIGAAACRVELGDLGAVDEFRAALSDLLASPGAAGNLHDHHLVLAFGAMVDAGLGLIERVAEAAGVSEVLDDREVPLRWDIVGHFERTVEKARKALGDEAFEAAKARGSALDDEGILAFLREQGSTRSGVVLAAY